MQCINAEFVCCSNQFSSTPVLNLFLKLCSVKKIGHFPTLGEGVTDDKDVKSQDAQNHLGPTAPQGASHMNHIQRLPFLLENFCILSLLYSVYYTALTFEPSRSISDLCTWLSAKLAQNNILFSAHKGREGRVKNSEMFKRKS